MSDTDILAVYNNKVNKLQRIDLRTGKAARNAFESDWGAGAWASSDTREYRRTGDLGGLGNDVSPVPMMSFP